LYAPLNRELPNIEGNTRTLFDDAVKSSETIGNMFSAKIESDVIEKVGTADRQPSTTYAGTVV
jgi:hypothetical protein